MSCLFLWEQPCFSYRAESQAVIRLMSFEHFGAPVWTNVWGAGADSQPQLRTVCLLGSWFAKEDQKLRSVYGKYMVSVTTVELLVDLPLQLPFPWGLHWFPVPIICLGGSMSPPSNSCGSLHRAICVRNEVLSALVQVQGPSLWVRHKKNEVSNLSAGSTDKTQTVSQSLKPKSQSQWSCLLLDLNAHTVVIANSGTKRTMPCRWILVRYFRAQEEVLWWKPTLLFLAGNLSTFHWNFLNYYRWNLLAFKAEVGGGGLMAFFPLPLFLEMSQLTWLKAWGRLQPGF